MWTFEKNLSNEAFLTDLNLPTDIKVESIYKLTTPQNAESSDSRLDGVGTVLFWLLPHAEKQIVRRS